MDDESHIRLVDSHSEGNRSNNHVHVFHQEGILIVRSGLRVETCMVRGCLYAVDIQEFCEFLHLLTAKTIYDSGFARILSDEFDDILLRIGLVPHFIVKVGSIE